jgi:hypothetical protein
MSTDLRVIQTESVLAISVCKIPIRKDNSHGDRKEHKERMNTDPRVTESVLAILAISVCKNPIRKTIHTEIAKNTKNG